MAGESARAVAFRKRAEAERLLRAAVAFERGAAGEEATADVLADLPALEWRVFHDVHWPGRRYANIDHVLVGPQGVFVVDSKAWTGYVDARAGVLRQNGHRRTRAVVAAQAAATAVAELVPGLDPDKVKQVICLVRPEPVFGWVDELMLCSTANIVTLLSSRPTVLSKQEVATTSELLAQSLHDANSLMPRVAAKVRKRQDKSAPGAQSRPRSKARSRNGSLAQSIVAVTAVAAVVLVFLSLEGPRRFADLMVTAVQGLDASIEPMGENHSVAGGATRPPLDVTMSRLGVTESRTPGTLAAPGEVLMAVQMTIRNQGDLHWVSKPGTSVVLRDDADATHRTVPAFTRVAAGRVLPEVIRLAPGRTTRGFMVFEVPRGTTISQVKLTVGPESPMTVRWSVD